MALIVPCSGQLPELEPKSFEQRRLDLAKILNDYQKLVNTSLPGNLEDTMTWDEFCQWYCLYLSWSVGDILMCSLPCRYSDRQTEVSKLEKSFASLVEDEREREGRLFRRWCTLALSDGAPESSNKRSAQTHRGSLIGSPDASHANAGNSHIAINSSGASNNVGTDRGSLFEAKAHKGDKGGDERDSMMNDPNFNFYNADTESEEAVYGVRGKLK
jgi:hypothetical protein